MAERALLPGLVLFTRWLRVRAQFYRVSKRTIRFYMNLLSFSSYFMGTGWDQVTGFVLFFGFPREPA